MLSQEHLVSSVVISSPADVASQVSACASLLIDSEQLAACRSRLPPSPARLQMPFLEAGAAFDNEGTWMVPRLGSVLPERGSLIPASALSIKGHILKGFVSNGAIQVIVTELPFLGGRSWHGDASRINERPLPEAPRALIPALLSKSELEHPHGNG